MLEEVEKSRMDTKDKDCLISSFGSSSGPKFESSESQSRSATFGEEKAAYDAKAEGRLVQRDLYYEHSDFEECQQGGIDEDPGQCQEDLMRQEFLRSLEALEETPEEYEEEMQSYFSEVERGIAEKVCGVKNGSPSTGRQEPGARLILPANKLKNCERFKITKRTPPVLKLKIIKQFPNQQIDNKAIFELAEMSDKYEEMEERMKQLYSEFPTDPVLDLTQVQEGTYAVLRLWSDQLEEAEDETQFESPTPIFKRIRFLCKSEGRKQTVFKVEYIDHFTQAVLDLHSDVLILDEAFAVLPPRVCAIKMEGVSYYKDGLTRKFFLYKSREYALDGLLTAEVQPSGEVVLWSDRFPRARYPYGINGFIIQSAWENLLTTPTAKLPPAGHSKPECYVVNGDHEGYLNIQFNNPVSKHFLDLFYTIPEDTWEFLQGSVKVPVVGEVYFAPHVKDGYYYRASVRKPEVASFSEELKPEDEVDVHFIDYGNEGRVKLSTLVRAVAVHYLLAKFPKMCVKVHLENIWSLDYQTYYPKYHPNDRPYIVHVVEDAVKEKPAEIILKFYDDEGQCHILNEILIAKEIADPILPFYDLKEKYEDHGAPLMTLSLKAPQYLLRGTGERLQVGDTLRVDVKYDERMPGNYFFIRPNSEKFAMKWFHFESKLMTLGDKLKMDRLNKKSTTWNHVKLSGVPRPFPTMCVLCWSVTVNCLARGVLVKEFEEKKKVAKSTSEDAGTKEKVKVHCWEVYMMDYGILEKINAQCLIYPCREFLEEPAFGILACHSSLGNKPKLESWWKRLSDLPLRQEESQKLYDKQQVVRRRVEVMSIAKTVYGEIAQVEWKSGMGGAFTNDNEGEPFAW